MLTLTVVKGDITEQSVDIIVNAANSSLLGGGGVDGAIHRKGGSAILDECRQIRAKKGKCDTGQAVITTAGNLPAKYVIHTVGSVWQGGNHHEKQLLASCYTQSLKLAVTHNAKTIAFPNISTGVYRFPKELACEVAINAVKEFIACGEIGELMEIRFVCFDDENFELYQKALSLSI
ncbi:O-acetyl-ADP-ribose deacetylase [Moraxella bovoculi]|uniref:O-acetyl-ADP-ribose deacetylase n=1 Tax=Moraxella bovoculi TaxID=386891 RepID=UPI0006244374|nr:O-acetyl-ADP-ribose deacetylase [Moraxella bovoculi]AKG15681.2 RNase III inhibitor [Moraxella bovoculi]